MRKCFPDIMGPCFSDKSRSSTTVKSSSDFGSDISVFAVVTHSPDASNQRLLDKPTDESLKLPFLDPQLVSSVMIENEYLYFR